VTLPGPERFLRKTRLLVLLLVVAVIYTVVPQTRTLTGNSRIDGQLGVVLGLFICAQPAANGVDVLFFDREALRRLSSGWLGIGWLLLNLFVLLCGWFVIVLGASFLGAR
jgi:hypothetical protein